MASRSIASYFIASRSMASHFIASRSIVEGFGETRNLDAHGIERVRAQPREKALPVGDAVDPAIQPGLHPFHRARILVIAPVEVVAASVAALDRRGVGSEGLVDDGGDLEGGGEDQPR